MNMKEEGDWSSERRRPHGSTTSDCRSIIPNWASLPPELVERIADCVLSTTGGVDAYMDMRAVCPSWHAAFADVRFRPRHWIMVDLKSRKYDPDARLFLHVTTGRFRRLRLPMLRDHIVLGASDGLIVLMRRTDLTGVRVLNPMTGDMLYFPARVWEDDDADEHLTAVSGSPRSTVVVWRDYGLRWHTVAYADPTSAEFREEEETGVNAWESGICSLVTFRGNIYYAGSVEAVFEFVAPAEQGDHERVLIAKAMSPDVDTYLKGDYDEYAIDYAHSYLVESAGELLLVCHRRQVCHRGQDLKLFRVDMEHKLLEEVKSLGCRALFLGNERCVSVDADKLPSVDADCIYMYDWVQMSEWQGRYMHVYDLKEGTMEILYSEPMLRANIIPRPRPSSPRASNHCLPPLSLIQVLLDYCNAVDDYNVYL